MIMTLTIFLFGCQKQNIIYSGHLEANEIYGKNVVYNDLVSPIISARLGTHAPEFDETEYAYFFDDATTTVNEDYIFVALQIPHSYKLNTNLSCHLHGYKSTSLNGSLNLELNYTWFNFGQLSGQTFTINKSFNLNNTLAKNNTYLDFGQINGTNKGISSTFKAKVTRKAGDTYAGNFYIDFFDCHFKQDTLGSFGEGVK